MKRTFTINISGTVFHIEEDAYEVLQSYLMKLKSHFGNNEEGKEILYDIEARIAEIFIKDPSEEISVITIEKVEEVIKIMGTPEDFVEEEGEEEEEEKKNVKRKRRLYRDPDRRVLGGVCGGLGAYFNMDPIILRIIFVLLFFASVGAALLVYFILWIAVPKAVTTTQKLEMRGQEATVRNIEKSIRDEVRDVKESYNKFKESDTYSKGKKKVEGAGEVTYSVIRVLLKVVVVFIGVIFIIGGFIGLLGMISSLAIGHSLVQGWPAIWGAEISFPEFLNYLVEPGTVTFGMITIGFLMGIPLLAILFVGTKMVFKYKTNNKIIGLSMVGLWLIALVSFIAISISQLGNFRDRASIVENQSVKCNDCKLVALKCSDDIYDTYDMKDWDIDELKMIEMDGEKKLVGIPKLNIKRASGENFIVMVKKSSRGRARDIARNYASELEYIYEVKDSIIVFNPYFLLNRENKWRDQKVTITVKVPEGKAVFIGEEMEDIIYDIENVTNTWDADMVGKIWEMKPEGLTLLE